MKKLLLISLVGMSCSAAVSPKAKEAFIADRLVPKEMDTLLNLHNRQLGRLINRVHRSALQKHGVWQFDWLPGYYVKYNVKRAVKQAELQKCIEKYSLDLLHTPRKQLYHIKGRPKALNSLNYVVIAEEVQEDPQEALKRMTLEQVTQFITLVEKTGHCSTLGCNYLRLSGGRVSFIDTDGTFNKDNPIRGIIGLLDHDLKTYYTADALYYLIDKIAEHIADLTNEETETPFRHIGNFLEKQNSKLKKKLHALLRERIAHHKGA